MGYLTPKQLKKIEPPRCECWVPPKPYRNRSVRCPFAASYELPDGTKVCGTHAKHPTPTKAWSHAEGHVQRAADIRAARRALADFEANGGTTLEGLKRKLGLST